MNKIAFFDLETTGSVTKEDHIVQIALCVYSWPEMNPLHEYKSLVKPGKPISSDAQNVHGISWAMVEKAPKFSEIAQDILILLEGCIIAGFNSNMFDIPILFNEFARAKITWDWKKHPRIDVGNIFKRKEERTLKAALKFYCDKELENAHDAMADVKATADVFKAQIERYDDLPSDVEELQLYSNFDKKQLDLSGVFYYGENDEIYLGIGDKKGQPAKQNIGMVQWIFKNNFPSDVHDVCKQLLGYK